MNISYLKTIISSILAIMGLLLVACGSISRLETGEAVAYKEAQIRPPLAVPKGMNKVPLNPENELQQISIIELADASRIPPNTGLVKEADVEAESGDLLPEPEVSLSEPIITVVITSKNPQLNTSHPAHIVWQAIGLGLERLAIPVTDRDRSNGLYFVDCLAASGQKIKKKRWWNILSNDGDMEPAICEISIVEDRQSIVVRINPTPEGVPSDQKIIDLLEELKFDLDRV